MDILEIEKYTKEVLPNLRKKLLREKDKDKLVELYNLYEDVLCLIAPYDFDSFNEYLEFDEDKSEDNRGFHHHRKKHMFEVHNTLNQMEVYDKYDIVLISLPPRTGKTTYSIRFLAWIIGKYPEHTQLGTSYSDNITSSFYNGLMEIVMSDRYKQMFPSSNLVNQNAKRQEIWLRVRRRYPSIAFVPVGGSVTGRSEAEHYLYVDDLVSGQEEALSPVRLEKLWEIFSTNFYQRKKQGAKMLVIGTRWSIFDPMTRLEQIYEGSDRFKSLKIPALDENGNSNFKFQGGFDESYYAEMKMIMDEITFNSLYQQEPIEREGLLYHKEDLQYYFDLPEDKPDTIIAVADTKGVGKDFVASPIGYVYGDMVYIEDVVYNNGLPEVTMPMLANKWVDNKVVMGKVEANNGGDFYAKNVDDEIKRLGGHTSIRTFFTTSNKDTKIITYADYVTKHFIFKDPSTYSPNSEYAKFMQNVFSWTQTGKNKFDDAPDSLAMLGELIQDLNRTSIKILDRRLLGL